VVGSPSYALVTPARDEVTNLERLAESVLSQTIRPATWWIVDDGSRDGTRALVRRLADRHGWVHLLDAPRAPDGGRLCEGRASGRDVSAFAAGVAALDELPDVLVKLDADVSFEPDFFERLLAAFDADPTLGIASGTCYEAEGDRWVVRPATEGHARGATRAWRRRCFEAVAPLEERLGWDVVDELRANALGWRTASLAGLPFRHHRPFGARDGSVRAWLDQGDVAHYVGASFWYVVARALHRARREPAALALVWGFAAARLGGQTRHPDPAVREALRRRQDLRRLARRMREATARDALPATPPGSRV
jgi:glycosyltransferase involved in cell wall biosynthesis